METIEIRIGTMPELAEAFSNLAREFQLQSEVHELILNSTKAKRACVVTVAGSIAIIAKCVVAYQKEHKQHLEIVTPEAVIKTQNYSAEELEKIFQSYRTNIVIKNSDQH